MCNFDLPRQNVYSEPIWEIVECKSPKYVQATKSTDAIYFNSTAVTHMLEKDTHVFTPCWIVVIFCSKYMSPRYIQAICHILYILLEYAHNKWVQKMLQYLYPHIQSCVHIAIDGCDEEYQYLICLNKICILVFAYIYIPLALFCSTNWRRVRSGHHKMCMHV